MQIMKMLQLRAIHTNNYKTQVKFSTTRKNCFLLLSTSLSNFFSISDIEVNLIKLLSIPLLIHINVKFRSIVFIYLFIYLFIQTSSKF